jgi:glycosyltransferase involved in cell wall biosynthesis
MDRANHALAEYLCQIGRKVELVAHRVAPGLSARPGIVVRKVPKPLDSYVLGEPFLDLWGRRAAARARARGDIVLVNGGNSLVAGANWVHYVHAAYDPPVDYTPRGLRRRLFHHEAMRRERAALARARIVIANSHTTKRSLVTRVGVPEAKIHVIYYGLDPRRFSLVDSDARREARRRIGSADRPLVAFVGALGDRRKGFDTLFEAWQRLCRQPSWDADLLAIGAGAELERFRARALALGLEQRIRLLGFRTDVDHLLAACDLLVSPSRYEAYGLGVAEALARGMPALVSASAGVAELYPDALRDLLLEDPESATELADKLVRWRERPDEQRARVLPLSERVRSRDLDQMGAEITRQLDVTGC